MHDDCHCNKTHDDSEPEQSNGEASTDSDTEQRESRGLRGCDGHRVCHVRKKRSQRKKKGLICENKLKRLTHEKIESYDVIRESFKKVHKDIVLKGNQFHY